MGSRPPPGCWVPNQGPPPRPGQLIAQEASEAYGKSSPLLALPHHPFPRGYVPPPVSMGTGGSRHGTLSTMRRRGDYRQGATAAGDPGVRSQCHGEGREGPKGNPPLPPQQPSASPHACACLRRVCDMRATRGRRQGRPCPPHPPPPPRGRGMRVGGGGEKRPPSPKTMLQGREAAVRCDRRVGRATTGTTRHAPLPCRGTSAAPRACAVLATCLRRRTDSEAAPPPPTPYSPTHQGKGRGQRGGGEGTWGGGDRGQTDVPGEETGGERWKNQKKKKKKQPRIKHTNEPEKKSEKTGTKPRRMGGGWGDMGPHETQVKYPTAGIWGPQRENPPPHRCSHCLCLRRACAMPTTGVLQRGDDKGDKGDDGSGMRTPPPPRAPRQGGEAAERGCGTNHTTVPKGSKRRASPNGGTTGGATAGKVGSHMASPPPPAEGQVPRLVPAPCLRRAYARGRTARRPPPPTPFSSSHPRKGRGQRGDGEGTWWGGAEDRPKRQGEERRGEQKKKKKKRTPTRQSRGRQQGQTGHGGSQEAEQGARERGTPLGRKARRQEPTPQQTGGGRGDKSPQKTLVRYPTSGVSGPPRCPYPPHLSAGNKAGYARDRWPAARGGTGLGGWPMGLTKSAPHGTYCGSCPVRGCG